MVQLLAQHGFAPGRVNVSTKFQTLLLLSLTCEKQTLTAALSTTWGTLLY